jgi:NifU-like protein involved in Fe-S cluster formation
VTYSELTRRYFDDAACVGVLAGPDSFRGAAGSRAQGTWVQFDVQVSSAPRSGTTIHAMRFLAFGCPHVIAVSAWLAEQAAGREARVSLPESIQSLRERFGIPVDKLGRLLIVEDAWIAAMRTATGAPVLESRPQQPHV